MLMTQYVVPRVSQPQDGSGIDWGNPLTRGLVDAIDMRGPPRSVLLGTSAIVWGTQGSYGWATPQGMSMNTNASFGGVYFERQDGLYTPPSTTHIALAAWDDWSGSGLDALFSTSNGGGTQDSFSARFPDPTTVSSEGGGSWGSSTIRGGGLGVYAARIGSGIFGAQFWNGRKVSQLNFATTVVSHTTSRLVLFGRRNLLVNRATKGRYVLHLIYNRALSDTEIVALSNNVWQIFTPEHLRIFIGTGGIVIPSLSFPGFTEVTQTSVRPRVTLTV